MRGAPGAQARPVRVSRTLPRMLLVVGDAQEETVVELGAAPPRGGTGPARITRQRGGSAANVAAFAAGVGYPARFAGQVGRDHTGQFVVDELRACGVDVHASRQGRTAAAVVVRSSGVTTRLVDRATATQCTTFVPALLDGVTLIHLPASTLSVEPLATAVEDLLGEAVERGIGITIDAAGVATIEEFGAAELRSLVAQLRPRAFFCNRVESEKLGLRSRDPMPGAAWTIVTAGARPAMLVSANGEARSYPVPPVAHVVDRDGVGDAFVTGFLLAHLAGEPSGTCVRAGHLLASRVLRQAGPRLREPQAEANEASVPTSTMS